MKANYAGCQAFVRKYEGGYVNHPADPGGATNKGVTQAVYDGYRTRKGEPARSVKLITNAELEAIYRKQYWLPCGGDELAEGLDLVVYDYGVNSGPSRAVKELQRALGVAVDGFIGMNTLSALEGKDVSTLINTLCDRRLAFLRSLKTWKTFGKGWQARVDACRVTATSMAEEGVATIPAPVEAVAAPAKAVVADQAKLKTAEGAGLSVAGVGAAGQACVSGAQQIQPHIGETVLGRLALAGFIVVMIVGGILIGYAYLKRIKEAGGFSTFLGGMFNARSA